MRSDITCTTGSAVRMDLAALKQTFSRRGLSRSIFVALVVGTILNVINQGETFLSSGEVDLFRGTLTYMVPFFVASYGAYGAYRRKP